MSYTIVGMFPTNEAADEASTKLAAAGFAKEDYEVSRYTSAGDYQTGTEYHEDEKTSNFWNWLFGDDEEDRKRYSYAGSKSNLVTVYTDDFGRAEKARDIMNDQGAINVNDFTKDKYSAGKITSEEKARIINKAKNNLYFTGESRTYTYGKPGMKSDMDNQGVSDETF